MKVDTRIVEKFRRRVDQMESIYGAEITLKALLRACENIIADPGRHTWHSREGSLPHAGNESGAPTHFYSSLAWMLIMREEDE